MSRIDAKECIPKVIVSLFLKFGLEAQDEQVACKTWSFLRRISLILIIHEFPLRLEHVHPIPSWLSIVRIKLDIGTFDILFDPTDFTLCDVVIPFVFTEPNLQFIYL